jgi:hypothetical protein
MYSNKCRERGSINFEWRKLFPIIIAKKVLKNIEKNELKNEGKVNENKKC